MHYEMLDPLFMLFHLVVPTNLWKLVVLFDSTIQVEDTKKD